MARTDFSLGQVYTPEKVANYMAELIVSKNPKSILEPCFGQGALINKVLEQHYPPHCISGVEYDSENFKKVKHLLGEGMKLYNQDFFDYNLKTNAILMNPPYLMQQFLLEGDSSHIDKKVIREKVNAEVYNFPLVSNMYIYFLLKSYQILVDGGHIVVIIPNVWMRSKNSNAFKSFLLNEFHIEHITEFSNDVFPEAEVEVCILVLKKEKYVPNRSVRIQKLDPSFKLLQETYMLQDTLSEEEKWLFFSGSLEASPYLIELGSISDSRRGISPPNKLYFMKKKMELDNNMEHCFEPILTSPKKVPFYSTVGLEEDEYIMNLKTQKEYLTNIEETYISNLENYAAELNDSSMQKFIAKKPHNWYSLNIKNGWSILFPYMIRKNKKFILNDSSFVIKDTFYEIHPHEGVNKYVLFALLNSTLVKYQLELLGRSYGGGMLKVQKYEMEKIKIVNPHLLNEEDMSALSQLGQRLSHDERNIEDILQEIDSFVDGCLGRSYKEEEHELASMRLNRKGTVVE